MRRAVRRGEDISIWLFCFFLGGVFLGGVWWKGSQGRKGAWEGCLGRGFWLCWGRCCDTTRFFKINQEGREETMQMRMGRERASRLMKGLMDFIR